MEVLYKDEFKQNGFVFLKGLFAKEEVRKLKEEGKAIIAEHGVDSSGVFLTLAAKSELFKQAAAAPGLVPVLKAIIGERVIFMSDKLVFKTVGTDFGSPWHQDYPYWYGSHKFSVWIALDDATPENGCLQVVPGSHKFGSINHNREVTDDKGFANRLNPADIDETAVVALKAEAGDAIVFHDLLYHASYPNTSGQDRWALISTYKDGNLLDPEYTWVKSPFAV
ncbi:phytanoyl-CoA dioxygenase family protein [Paenibacillus silvisoli]|uniref:phytanoyl-CoA dioxygenase family protein n=1 Tax=Paenibacillus silvisoli TaxID=3110539 RepID=UPI00280572F4|nr:phytanoyl-CoA dioxygenase family protein [Paenibacillus silvisoli]